MAERDTWSLGWRLECEARHLLRLPLDERRRELAAPARARRRETLEAIMLRLWREEREERGR